METQVGLVQSQGWKFSAVFSEMSKGNQLKLQRARRLKSKQPSHLKPILKGCS